MATNSLRALVRKHLNLDLNPDKHSVKLTRFNPGKKTAETTELPRILLDGRVNVSKILAPALFSMRISKQGKLSHKILFYNHTTQGFIFITGRSVKE